MHTHPRRVFLMTLAGSTASLTALAQPKTMVDEKDPQAIALGYVADTKRVDAKKFPKHTPAQLCSNCSLYQGKATDKIGGCAIFGTKQVAGPGWCSAWVKKS